MAIQQFPLPEAAGIPTGDTAGRPANPVIGDVYYNGELAILEIFNGIEFFPCSAPSTPPSIAVADVGTSAAYGSAQGAVTITSGIGGGPVDSFLVSASTGGYTATTTGTTVTITVGNNGSYTFSGQALNSFGLSAAGASVTETLTTVPEAPAIGTATTSGATTAVTVTWTLGESGGKNLSSISITPFLDGTTPQTAATAATTSSTSHTFANLTQGSSFTFKVKATNANGDSADSVATNSITVPTIVVVDFLVVAGGAGGLGGNNGFTRGGGGAGGTRCTVTATGGGGSLPSALGLLPSTNFTVTVGAGGAVGGNDGVSSVFSNISTVGGGSSNPTNGNTGGSGGGGGRNNNVGTLGNGGNGTTGEGFAGGAASSGVGGGGGGGGSANVGGVTSNGGAGGNGISTNINGNSVSYGGGGGGASSGNGGAGGNGGGGNGSSANAPANVGGVNTGGGSGGALNDGSGKAGGSGIVVLRYSDAFTITIGAGLTGTESAASGGFKRATLTAGSGNVSWA